MDRPLLAAALASLLALTAACGDDPEPEPDGKRIVLSPPSEGADHTHPPGQGHAASGPEGDGTAAQAGGYRIASVVLPEADGPGEMSFRVLDDAGRPLTEYTEEQTKLLHLYVVRADLGAFRHLHPTLDDDGTWRARVDLGSPGEWRVVAELTPKGADRPVVLGTTLTVPCDWEPQPAPRGDEALTGDDGVVRVSVLDAGKVGPDGRLRLAVSSLAGEPLALGSYLGTSGHLTGFALDGGGFVHVHPYGAPEQDEDGTVLTFHTTFTEAADYRMFLQVRVEGLLHQVAVTVPVS